MSFKLNQYARDFYGDKDYTIAEGILSGKGQLIIKRDMTTNWKNRYFYKEGLLVMQLDGRQAKSFAKENNIEIKEGV